MRASGRRYTAFATLLSTRTRPSCSERSSMGDCLAVVVQPASRAHARAAAMIVGFMATPQSEAVRAEDHSVPERVGATGRLLHCVARLGHRGHEAHRKVVVDR